MKMDKRGLRLKRVWLSRVKPWSAISRLGVIVSIDYAFMAADEKEAETAAIMIAYEHKTKAIWALEVDHKGVDAGTGADWLVERLQVAGYGGTKITLKSDQEIFIKALKVAIATKRDAETSLIGVQ